MLTRSQACVIFQTFLFTEDKELLSNRDSILSFSLLGFSNFYNIAAMALIIDDKLEKSFHVI